MNILILSAGTRNKVVQAFKREVGDSGRVVATDASPLAPALYDADKAYIVPRIDAPGYIDRIIEICVAEHIQGVFSLIDPELSLIARERKRFEEVGVTPVVSPYALCEMSLDKYEMYEYLRAHDIRTARCWTSKRAFLEERERDGASYPVFVKPRRGSASLGINRVESDEMLEVLFAAAQESGTPLLIQEYMRGQEYGLDLYVDMMTGKCTSLFLKKKIKMRAGETDKSISVQCPEICRIAAAFAENAGYRGMIDIDLFHDEHGAECDSAVVPEGEWYLSEVNPRFGGGYPHAYACGVNFPRLVLENLEGRETPDTIGQYRSGVAMMKYNEICIREESQLI